jgi:hypothetical protein
MSAERVLNWTDTTAVAAMLATDQIDTWQVVDGRVVVGLYRPATAAGLPRAELGSRPHHPPGHRDGAAAAADAPRRCRLTQN